MVKISIPDHPFTSDVLLWFNHALNLNLKNGLLLYSLFSISDIFILVRY